MAGGGTKAVVAALLANTGIAITKFAAWGLTQSASMLAEAIHSVADAGNQVLLLVGGKRAQRQANELHQFGYGRERYVYSFIVAIVLFSVGGLFALYEGWHKVHDPHPLDDWKWVPVAVLVAAIIMETFSFRTAIVETNKVRGDASWSEFVRNARSPELPVILLEDFAALTGLVLALIGVVLTIVTGNGVWDGAGSMAIGVLLVVVAVFLAIEMKSLLLGESATRESQGKIVAAIENVPGVQRLIHIKTLHLGPEEVLVAAKIAFEPTADAAVVAETINAAERAVRGAEPMAQHIYLEPDIYVEGYVPDERPPVPGAPAH
ncbi:cation diffusion facilitator family transporter [Kribbella flavida DSM 17836]|uniref:Cation diffusion facilitator family transporter n=1 Tax=Kribbella flavida (strain DSM 17836 / JCM 10339 / NBRC 14399) TaxID=479435 RepID=D2PMF4_KRIFD|nr:cation diffusion facilitator family transporter [Kribbella flavida]ADB30698.1 cation diffusion facilitator family transporter [Kribbella flavida DSM 17836]